MNVSLTWRQTHTKPKVNPPMNIHRPVNVRSDTFSGLQTDGTLVTVLFQAFRTAACVGVTGWVEGEKERGIHSDNVWTNKSTAEQEMTICLQIVYIFLISFWQGFDGHTGKKTKNVMKFLPMLFGPLMPFEGQLKPQPSFLVSEGTK